MENSYKNWWSSNHSVHKLHAHLVFTTKYRKSVITERVSENLKQSFKEVCSEFGVALNECESDGDHIHLLITCPPKVSLSNLTKELKRISSKEVRSQKFPEVQKQL